MTSFRRKLLEIEAEAEDFNPRSGPRTLADWSAMIEEVGKLYIDGYTKVTVTIKGRPDELEDLAKELSTWAPTHGWSPDAQKLFKLLRGEHT